MNEAEKKQAEKLLRSLDTLDAELRGALVSLKGSLGDRLATLHNLRQCVEDARAMLQTLA